MLIKINFCGRFLLAQPLLLASADHNWLSPPLQNNVFMYYGLSNFYQNHRRYVKSRDDSQLNGDLSALKVCQCNACGDGDYIRLALIVFTEAKQRV